MDICEGFILAGIVDSAEKANLGTVDLKGLSLKGLIWYRYQ